MSRAFAVWNWPFEKRARWLLAAAALVCVISLVAAYEGAYYSVVRKTEVLGITMEGGCVQSIVATYPAPPKSLSWLRLDQVFEPAHRLDRWLRPVYWSSVGSTGDVPVSYDVP